MAKIKTTEYKAIEENGVQVWPKALVKAVYLACSEEMRDLNEKGFAKVIETIPECERCKHKGQACNVGNDGMGCDTCSEENHCSRQVDYMWKTLSATWTKEYSITWKEFRVWYPKVMAPESIYVTNVRNAPGSEQWMRKGGKVVRIGDRGGSLESVEEEDRQGDEEDEGDEDEDEDENRDKEKKEKEGDQQGNDQDPSPPTSALLVQKDVDPDNPRLQTRLLKFEEIMEQQTAAPDIARLREGYAALYSVFNVLRDQNEEFRRHLSHLLDDILFLHFLLEVEGEPELKFHKDIKDKLYGMAAGVLKLLDEVRTTDEQERIKKIFNPGEGSSGTKRSGGNLEEGAESPRKRGCF